MSSRSSSSSDDNHKCLMAKESKDIKRDEDSSVETLKALTQELEALKLSYSALVSECDILSNKYACAIDSSIDVALLEQDKQVLNDKLEKLTSEHMVLQATHKELEYSHEKLVESHAILDIAHEVVLSMVKSIQPHTHMHMLTC